MELEKKAAMAEIENLRKIDRQHTEARQAHKRKEQNRLRSYMLQADADAEAARAELRHERLLSRILRFSNGFYRKALANNVQVDNTMT